MFTLYGYGYDNPSKPFKVWLIKWDRNVGNSETIYNSTKEL